MRVFAVLCLTIGLWAMHPADARAQNEVTGIVPEYYPENNYCPEGCDRGGDSGAAETPQQVVRTPSGRPEIVLSGPAGQIANLIAALPGLGAKPLRVSNLPALGQSVLVIDPGGRLRGDKLQREVAALAPSVVVARHGLFRFAGSAPRLYAPAMLGVAAPNTCKLGSAVRIGLIDGPVDAGHPALRTARIVQTSALGVGETPSDITHGTAIAALMVGQDSTGVLSGFAQGARLFAVTAFAREREDESTSVERIAAALDWLVANDVQVINMSFAGPQNAVLDRLLEATAAKGIVLVAAAGNDGKDLASYPAASEAVMAVTAVDASSRLYRAANYGPHIEFAAPGVDLYVARGADGGYVSGTSYAAPIISAFAARLLAQGIRDSEGIRSALRSLSHDLGDAGRDPRFGWGLVRAPGC
jgi:subtilisin family serine protease